MPERSTSHALHCGEETLSVSVVIPTHGRPTSLARLLVALAEQSLQTSRFEVIVIDDGSPLDRQPATDTPASNQGLIRQQQQGPAAARNAGAAAASGELIAFIDDDCVPDTHWLTALLDAHHRAPDAMLGGQTRNGLKHNGFSRASENLLRFFDEEAQHHRSPLSFMASNNLAMSRAHFLALGGFDTTYPLAAGEDRDLCRRWTHAGRQLLRAPDALVHHYHALNLHTFWRQHYHYGRGAARFHRTAPPRYAADHSGTPQQRPSAGFYLRLLLHPLTQRNGTAISQRMTSLALVLVSQLAVTAGLLSERFSEARAHDTVST